MSVRIQVLFYSMYGHVYRMSEAVVEGAREVEGAEVSLYHLDPAHSGLPRGCQTLC